MEESRSPVPLPAFGLATDILRQARAPAAARQAGALELLGLLHAEELPAAGPSEPPVQLVSVEMAGELYGIPIGLVHEVLRVGSITRVPGAPLAVLGITSLRGRILPVIDLRCVLGLAQSAPDRRSRILVAELEGRLVGLLVEAAHQVLRIPGPQIEPPPEGAERIGGVVHLPGGSLLLLLETQRLLEGL